MYDFSDLSPLDFEELVRDLFKASWQQRLESFGPGRDGGVDLRHLAGQQRVIVQAKHYIRTGAPGLLRAIAHEREKAIALQPTRYVLATSVPMTPGLKRRMVEAMPGVPLTEEDIFGLEDLNNLIGLHPEVERRHFKLWLASSAVLDRILLSEVYNRTAAEMEIVRRMVPRFVQNRSVAEAEARLAETGALIIAGAPGVGKTTLARMLLWRHAEQGWRIFVVDDIEEAMKVAGEGERRLILFDDFLGQVRLSSDHVRGLDARLPPLLAKVAAQKDLRFILTTRDYILAQAQLLSARLTNSQNAKSYVLDVGLYTREVRARILYNHIHFSTLSDEQIGELLADDFYLEVIDHKNFNPRLIEMLTQADLLSAGDLPVRGRIEHALANPHELWHRPYRQHMSQDARTLLLAATINGGLVAIEPLKSSFRRISQVISAGVTAVDVEARFRTACGEIEGSALVLVTGLVRFANPGLRDYLLNVIREDRLLPIIVPEIETRCEVAECLAVFAEQPEAQASWKNAGSAWIGAFDRAVGAGHCGRYERFMLALDLHDLVGGEPMRIRVAQAADEFLTTDMDGDEVSEACSLLERIATTSLPPENEADLRSCVAAATAKMLRNFADSLNLEDVQSLDEALFSFGGDEDLAADAIHVAMSALARAAASDVEQIRTLDELDEYERNITDFLASRGHATTAVERAVESRRDALETWGEDDRGGGYSGLAAASPVRMSDGEIRSMFGGLRQ